MVHKMRVRAFTTRSYLISLKTFFQQGDVRAWVIKLLQISKLKKQMASQHCKYGIQQVIVR